MQCCESSDMIKSERKRVSSTRFRSCLLRTLDEKDSSWPRPTYSNAPEQSTGNPVRGGA